MFMEAFWKMAANAFQREIWDGLIPKYVCSYMLDASAISCLYYKAHNAYTYRLDYRSYDRFRCFSCSAQFTALVYKLGFVGPGEAGSGSAAVTMDSVRFEVGRHCLVWYRLLVSSVGCGHTGAFAYVRIWGHWHRSNNFVLVVLCGQWIDGRHPVVSVSVSVPDWSHPPAFYSNTARMNALFKKITVVR